MSFERGTRAREAYEARQAAKDAMAADTNNDRLLALLEQQAATMQEQVARTAPRENPNYIAKSVFLKEDGSQWATDLKCDMYLGSIHLNRTPMTKGEVEAWNRLQPIDKGTLTKVDGSEVLAKVIPKETATGKIERLTVQMPMKKEDNPQHYGSLQAIAEQLAAQVVAA